MRPFDVSSLFPFSALQFPSLESLENPQLDPLSQSACDPGSSIAQFIDQFERSFMPSSFCQPQSTQSFQNPQSWQNATMPSCGYPFASLENLSSSICPSPLTQSLPVCPQPPLSQPQSLDQSKVFVVGDLKHFGGTTVRAGLKEMLRPTQGLKDRAGERTHSVLSPDDAATVRGLLASKDPNVLATLKTKVPDGQSLVIGQDGTLLNTVNTRNDIIPDASLQMADHLKHINDKNVGRVFDRSAGGQLSVQGSSYNVAGTELHSPIKVSLDGSNARLNSTNGFNIAMNGFGGQVTKTTGGLNSNEAWLVRDRDGQGIVKNGVVNGNDVYGDHNGKMADGYQDLARDFADEVRTDPKTGERYIDLTNPNSRAAQQLKLLDANGQLRPAASVLSRIDVSATNTNERDATDQNEIKERGQVTYRDGHKALSADQWFRAAKAV